MLKINVCEDIEEARYLWQRHWPQESLFDLWPVRECFQKQFRHHPFFLVAYDNNRFCGMLALSWIDEECCFGHFPGELWQGRTWLEQNRIVAENSKVASALLCHIPGPAVIRYIENTNHLGDSITGVDETGYLFVPGDYNYSFQTYLQSFSGKARQNFRREMKRLEAGGLCYRLDCYDDLEHMFRMNLENFKDGSYFNDSRFLKSFENLAAWLHSRGLLRITTVVIEGGVAAVDMGAVWNGTYTLLAGGTNWNYPGVAKLINFFHMQRACQERLAEVDFLCGDFNWKNRFHLTPRALYKVCNQRASFNTLDLPIRQSIAYAG